MYIKDIKDVENFQFQGTTSNGNIEFYITISNDSFVGDFFNKNIQSMQEAYIESLYLEADILEEAIKEAQEYI